MGHNDALRPLTVLVYSMGNLLVMISIGIYYALSRPYVGIDLGGGDYWILILAGIEYGTSIMSIIWGAVADHIGRRNIILLAPLGAIPLYFIFKANEPFIFTILAGITYTLWSIGYASSVSAVLIEKSSAGKNFTFYALSGGIGWGLGASIAWPIYYTLGIEAISIILSLCFGIGYLWQFIRYPREAVYAIKLHPIEIARIGLEKPRYFTLAIIFGTAGFIMGTTILALRLTYNVESVMPTFFEFIKPRFFYGIFYGGIPVLVSIPSRFLAGRLVMRYRPYKLYIFSIISYALIIIGMWFSSGWVFIILWLTPIYPFYDTSMYVGASMRVKGMEATASGIVIMAQSIAGLVVSLITALTPLAYTMYILHIILTLFIISILLITYSARRGKDKSYI